MPISEYYGGHGRKVMQDMKKRYGSRAKEVFYATANKRMSRKRGTIATSGRGRGGRE